MKINPLLLSLLLLFTGFFFSACQQNDTTSLPSNSIEEAMTTDENYEAQPISSDDDLKTMESELDETVIEEEDFSDL